MKFKKHAVKSWSTIVPEKQGKGGEKRYHLSSKDNEFLVNLELNIAKSIKIQFNTDSLLRYNNLFYSYSYFDYLCKNYMYQPSGLNTYKISEKYQEFTLNNYQELVKENELIDATITIDSSDRVFLGSTDFLSKLSMICPGNDTNKSISGIILTKGKVENLYVLDVYFDDIITKKYSIEIIRPQTNIINKLNDSSNNSYADIFFKEIFNIGLSITSTWVKRFICSLETKPFLILTGLSGCGKTKLAQAFVSWICASPSQYKIIPVGADWTNREPILGYPNGLDNSKYESPESGALQIVLDAIADKDKPYFLILDEMNLSHVERYFADFLSVMESNDTIKLHAGGEKLDSRDNKIKDEISWPDNLFIIGTVNIDETTYMFSPKVLDRANVIEFRIKVDEMAAFLGNSQKPDMKKLFVDNDKEKGGLGQSMAIDFLNKARDKEIERSNEDEQNVIKQTLYAFFVELQAVGAEYGYRTASEIELLLYKLSSDIPDLNERLDIAIMQKLLPKLHGSRKKLIAPLETLAGFCIDNSVLSMSEKGRDLYKKWSELKDDDLKKKSIRFKISFDKIMRMHNNAMQNGYTSYAEA